MYLQLSNTSLIGDYRLSLYNGNGAGINTINENMLNKISLPKSIKLIDAFKYIPELKKDFEGCYQNEHSQCIPVETIVRRDKTLYRINKAQMKHQINYSLIVDYPSTFLTPQVMNDYIILRCKLGQNIKLPCALDGQRFLIERTTDNYDTSYYLNEILAYCIGLFSLGYLSRYTPNVWYPFIQKDESGERAVILKFLRLAYRRLPNLVLNMIFDREIIFSNSIQGTKDISKDFDSETVKKIVKEVIGNK